MKLKVREIIEVIESFAPLKLQEHYDNSGMQVGDYEQEVESVLLCTDITEAVVDEAIEKGIGMVMSHHPLMFNGVKRITGDCAMERIILKAIRNNITLYSGHTNVDKCYKGVSYKMAEQINLQDVRALVPENCGETDDFVGLGVIGELPEPMDLDDLYRIIKRKFNVHTIRCSKPVKKSVRRIAMCGGSGSGFIKEAINCNADVYITADIKYHDFFKAEDKIILADIGHFESEHITKLIFKEQLIEKFPNFAVEMANSDTNPVCFV